MGVIYINEWFPNPAGKDDGEFVELYNSGGSAARLGGYSLGTGVKKKFSLSGYVIPARGYLVLDKVRTKLTLKNTDGGLWLYGPGGLVLDHASFTGAAPIEKSFSREYYGGGDGHAQNAQVQAFVWTTPTPGRKNEAVSVAITTRNYPLGVSLAGHMAPAQFVGIMTGTAVVLLGIFIYVIQKNEDLQKLFFGRDRDIR